MPLKPARPCRHPGCSQLSNDKSRYCQRHIGLVVEARRRYDEGRGTATQRGYDARWQRYRLAYLSEHPLCVMCGRDATVTAAAVVDHIRPHRGDSSLFWAPSNHQALCKHHHDVKTAREDGAFGNRG